MSYAVLSPDARVVGVPLLAMRRLEAETGALGDGPAVIA